MNFFQPLDQYCERLDASVFAEPLNLFSNAAFLIAAMALVRHLKRHKRNPPPGSWLLARLIFAVGIGSSLFHSFANMWSQMADVIPIVIFVFTYLVLFLKNVAKLPGFKIGIMMMAFFLVTAAAAALADKSVANGSELYFGTWIALACIACFYAGRAKSRSYLQVAGAAILFSISLYFRTVDMKLCDSWVYGTHMMWHLCNGSVMYFITKAYISEP